MAVWLSRLAQRTILSTTMLFLAASFLAGESGAGPFHINLIALVVALSIVVNSSVGVLVAR